MIGTVSTWDPITDKSLIKISQCRAGEIGFRKS